MSVNKALAVLRVIVSQPKSALVSAVKKRIRKAGNSILSIPAILPAIAKTREAAKRYISELPDGVFSIGRMGNYHYDNMDMIIKDCLRLFRPL